MQILLLVLGFCYCSAQEWSRLTMYHVNPRKYGPVPVNMDTGDARGDLFFDLMQVLTVPLACADKSVSHHSFNCNNPEATSPNDVVNKITLEVRNGYSGYAMCNIARNNTVCGYCLIATIVLSRGSFCVCTVWLHIIYLHIDDKCSCCNIHTDHLNSSHVTYRMASGMLARTTPTAAIAPSRMLLIGHLRQHPAMQPWV